MSNEYFKPTYGGWTTNKKHSDIKYIDSESTVKEIKEQFCNQCKNNVSDIHSPKCYGCQIAYCIEIVSHHISAYVQPVVRCEHCKFHNKSRCNYPIFPFSHVVNYTDYCSHGKRKDGDKHDTD